MSQEAIDLCIAQLQSNVNVNLDLGLLFQSIKTHKSVESLKALLKCPRPDVNEAARACEKVSFFRKALRLNAGVLKEVPNKLQLNVLEQQKMFSECAQEGDFGVFYRNAHKIDPNTFKMPQQFRNARHFHKILALVEEDFKIYQENARQCAFGDATPQTEAIKRLRFALKCMDPEKVDPVARKYLLEHHLLTKRFQVSVKQVAEAFKLFDGK